MRFFVNLPALMVLTGLAGCAAAHQGPILYCPNLAVMAGTSRAAVFDDGGAKIAAAQVTGVAGTCKMIPGEFGLRISVQPGFAVAGAAVSLPYYVAIVDGPVVVDKRIYTVALDPAAGSAVVTPPVVIETPDQPGTAREEILVGFQLTPAQLAYAAANPGG